MRYQQFWLTSKTKVKNIWERQWENYVCFASLSFQNDYRHYNIQLVHPEVVDKYVELLKLLEQYLVFTWEKLEQETTKQFYEKTSFGKAKYAVDEGHVGFLIIWKDSSFFNNYKLRLFFLTLIRIGQESPWVLSHWEVQKGFEDICKWSAECHNERELRDLSGPFSSVSSGHLVTWHSGITRYPSIETVIFYLLNKEDSIHHCTHTILKGNTYND